MWKTLINKVMVSQWQRLSSADRTAIIQRNQARLGPRWRERQRSWDERLNDYGPAVPLLPLVWTALMALFVVALAVLLSGCADIGYTMNELHGLNCRPEALQDGKCTTTRAAAKEVKP